MTAPEPRSLRWGAAGPLLILWGISFTVRLLALRSFAESPLFLTPLGDEKNFHDTAVGLLGGEGAGAAAFFYQPLYTFYLAAVYRVLGVSVFAVKTLQLALGSLTTLLFCALGQRLGGRRLGWLTGLGHALYGPMVFFEAQLLDPVLVVPLVALALLALLKSERGRPGLSCLLSGLCLGLALMARPNLLLVVPAIAGWLVLRAGSTGWRRLVPLAALGLGLGLGMLPSWIHNWRSGQGVVPVSASGGHSFYLGNNPQANGAFHVPRGDRIDDTSHEAYRASLTAVAEAARGRGLTPSEVSSYWYERGLGFWREQPGQALLLTLRKAGLAISAAEIPIHHSFAFGCLLAPVLGWLPGFGVAFPFALLGALAGWRRNRREAGLLVLFAGVYVATLVLFYVADRYRIVILPSLLALAALGLDELGERFRLPSPEGRRAASLAGLVLLGGFALGQLPLAPPANPQRLLYDWHNLTGKAWGDRGEIERAEAAFRAAVAVAGEGRGAVARTNLGLLLAQRGDWDSARQFYRQAAAADPEYRPPRLQLALLCERGGEIAEAIRWWEEIARLEADPAPIHAHITALRNARPAAP